MSGPLKLMKLLAANSAKYVRELDPAARAVLTHYQELPDVNTALRSGAVYPGNDILTLDRILREAPRLPEDVVVHRGAPRGVYPGKEPAYLSTAFDEADAQGFTHPDIEALADLPPELRDRGAQVYHVKVRGDTPFVMPGNLVPWYGEKSELLFPRGATLRPSQDGLPGWLDYLRDFRFAEGGSV